MSRLKLRQSAFQQYLGKELEAIQQAGTFKRERIITSAQKDVIQVNNRSVINFCANNYLGLSSHPEVIQASKNCLDKYGAGLSSVRFICGTQAFDLLTKGRLSLIARQRLFHSTGWALLNNSQDIHKELESKIAKFHRKEDAILYPSCFDANGGLFEALLTEQDAVISDSLNHASIIDGIRLCKAKRFRYNHSDMADLEAKLQEADNSEARIKLIATDGAFSMDGDIAPLDKICKLADQYGALVFVDECHATGFLGKTGRGTPELFGVEDEIDIINSTLGKALGGAAGGYTAASSRVVDLLRQRSRPYLFSNSLPPAVVGGASKVFDLLGQDTSLVERIQANTKRFREAMAKSGFTVRGHPNHPIAPVMIGDAKLASQFADALLEKGIYVIGFSYPVVPKGLARIRVQISAIHTPEQIDQAVRAFVQVGTSLGVIPSAKSAL